jgi:hypothetical protein
MILRLGSMALISLALGACASQPRNTADVCSMFEERRSWFQAAERAEQKWGVPVHVSMAFIYQESAYQARIRPARTKVLWVIPWSRPSSAYGYAQALDGTWDDYRRATGKTMARRSNFNDAMDFIGWYNRNSHLRNGIALNDPYNLYLAYYQGHTGYARGSYQGNTVLLTTARRVEQNALRYQTQYQQCRPRLDRNWVRRVLS